MKEKREAARREISRRDASFRGKVTVHMGTCGIAAGAKDVLTAFQAGLGGNGLRDVMLSTSGCAGMCSKEPMASGARRANRGRSRLRALLPGSTDSWSGP